MSSRVELELMRPQEVVDARERAPVAFLPIGPLEWHGPHLPLGVDGIHAHRVAVGVAHRVGGVVLPPLFVGADAWQGPATDATVEHLGVKPDVRVYGMDYPGNSVQSTYIDEGVVSLLARDFVRSLKRQRYELIVLVNGHGAANHMRALRMIAIEETETESVEVLCATAWIPPHPPAYNPGHADRLETSILMSLEPDAVDVSRLPPLPDRLAYADFGIVDGPAFEGYPQPDLAVPERNDPRKSSSAHGAQLMTSHIAHLEGTVRERLAQGRARRRDV